MIHAQGLFCWLDFILAMWRLPRKAVIPELAQFQPWITIIMTSMISRSNLAEAGIIRHPVNGSVDECPQSLGYDELSLTHRRAVSLASLTIMIITSFSLLNFSR